MAKGFDDPRHHALSAMASQCRTLSAASEYPELRRQLSLLADEFEVALASWVGAEAGER